MKFLRREELVKWLDSVASVQRLIAPKDIEGVLLYRPVADTNEIVWNYSKPVMSIKEYFFPPTERLMTIKKNDGMVELVEQTPTEKRIIFGVRPCDSRGLLALDAVFLNADPVDLYYAARRENTTLVGVACKEIGETCFCTSVGGAPNDPSGMDIMLTPVDDGYLVEAFSEKGWAILNILAVTEVNGKKTPLKFDQFPNVDLPENWPEMFKSALWDHVSERCLSCRICAYLCPTCRCFDVRDEHLPSEEDAGMSQRIRCWDSCAGEVYRQIAGGHNPRKAKRDRVRNRAMCKFYYFPEQYGAVSCTGCGRCIEACPVNVDITEILGQLVEMNV